MLDAGWNKTLQESRSPGGDVRVLDVMVFRIYPNTNESSSKGQQAEEKNNHRRVMYKFRLQISDRLPMSHSVLVAPSTPPAETYTT